MAVAFDTLKLAERLGAGGFTPQQAQTAAAAFADVLSVQVTTKVDLEALRLQLEAKIAGVDAKIAGVEGKIAGVEGKIAESKANILKWMFATIGFQTLAISGSLFAFLKLFTGMPLAR